MHEPSRFPRPGGTAGGVAIAQASKFVFLLKFRDLVGQTLPGNPEDFNELLQFRHAPDEASSIDDQLAHAVHHVVEARERNTNGLCLGAAIPHFSSSAWRCVHRRGRRGFRIRFQGLGPSPILCVGGIFQEIFRNPARHPCQERSNGGPHLVVARPLAVQEFPQGIDRLQTNVRDLRTGMQRSVTKLPDQILQAVRHRAQPPQAHLRRRSFDRVNGTEKPVDLFGGRIRFEPQQTLRCDLQMLFCFRDEKVQYFPGNIVIFRQIVRQIAFGRMQGIARFGPLAGGQIISKRGWGRWHASECKCVAMLECGNVIGGFAAVRTDLQQVKFKNRDRVRQELGERAVRVRTQLRLAGVLKDVRQPPGDIREKRIAPAACGLGQFVRGIVKPGEIVSSWTEVPPAERRIPADTAGARRRLVKIARANWNRWAS